MKEIPSAINALAEKLGVAAEHLWVVLIRQAPISAATEIVVMTCVAMFLLAAFRWLRHQDQHCEDFTGLGWILWGLAVTVTLFAVALDLPFIIAGFLNPEYWALKEIIK